MDNYKLLSDFVDELKAVNTTTTNHVSVIRELSSQINLMKNHLLSGSLVLTDQDIEKLRVNVDNVVSGKDVKITYNIETTHSIKMFQLGVPETNVKLDFVPGSLVPPEKGTILQKIWKIRFKDNTTGYAIMSETTREDLSTLFNAQISEILSMAPTGSVEDLDIILNISDITSNISDSRDLSDLLVGFEKPGLVARQLQDIDIDTDPALTHLSSDIKEEIKTQINDGNSNITQDLLDRAGLYSSALGPSPNLAYSDLKRFKVIIDGKTHTVTFNIPVISWGEEISGIPIRNPIGPKNKENRKDDGTSYIVDLGGIDPVIRNGTPNPLPPTRYYNNGPSGSTDTEGALERYKGGKCLGINTTGETATFETLHRESNGIINLSIPPMTAMWKLDRSTFDGGRNHAYYTVYSASRSPPAGFMGVVLSPKQNRLGRGRGEDASGVTLANGLSKTGKTFNEQNEDGPILTNGSETPINLKGVTCDYDGHGMDPHDLLRFLSQHNFIRGEHYYTIPANATQDTVEDILIPEGQFIPQISQAVGTLLQFGNGKYIPDGGPNRFQSGLIPFLPGTPAYTPEWHINFIYYNMGEVECDNQLYNVTDVAKDNNLEAWVKPSRNASYGAPGPDPSNPSNSGYSPAFPDTFDPVQLRCGIKGANNPDYVDSVGGHDGEITLNQLQALEEQNKIFLTEAPGGAKRGWVKFLVVNCPLPVIVTINVVGEEENPVTPVDPNPDNENCKTCTCNRESTGISINGDFNPVWLEETSSIGSRILNMKVGDNIVVKSTSGTQHGVSVRMDGMTSATSIDNTKTLEQMQGEVLEEIKNYLDINNETDISHNIIALADDVISFHGGIPITFSEQSVTNPTATPDGVVITDLTIKEGTENMSGTLSCTVHGVSMSFRFTVCE